MIINNTIKILNTIIDDAINNNASDIHIKDNCGTLEIEFRIDGILKKQNYSNLNSSEIIARIKLLAKMNVAQKRISQDGSFTYMNYDLRVCIIPSITGENVVIRLLNSNISDYSLSSLGFSDNNINAIHNAINKLHGLILITGPTGSGKSTTLLSITNLLNNGSKKIISIEDPVEYKINGIVQIQVNEDLNMSFANILRATLRSDPDIIIISEIRDEITAQIAIRASLTGHLVLATLHTNDCISTYSRLIDMGIPKYLIDDSLLLIISQKLLTKNDNKLIKTRLMINEVLELNDDTKRIFSEYTFKNDILKSIKSTGFKTMEDDLIGKGYNL